MNSMRASRRWAFRAFVNTLFESRSNHSTVVWRSTGDFYLQGVFDTISKVPVNSMLDLRLHTNSSYLVVIVLKCVLLNY